MSSSTRRVRVWDPLVRIGHWLLVVAFATAFVTQGDPEVVHTWAGYVLAAYVMIRIVWGFIGPADARFSSFVTSPARAAQYLAGLFRGSARRYLGHSPAGGIMVLALLASLAATTTVGMALYAVHDHKGPLAGLIGGASPAAEQAQASGETREGAARRREEDPREELLEELHEFLAYLTLGLVIAHLGGVVLASRVHRENLTKAMITGDKDVREQG
jgi:cytochrome b